MQQPIRDTWHGCSTVHLPQRERKYIGMNVDVAPRQRCKGAAGESNSWRFNACVRKRWVVPCVPRVVRHALSTRRDAIHLRAFRCTTPANTNHPSNHAPSLYREVSSLLFPTRAGCNHTHPRRSHAILTTHILRSTSLPLLLVSDRKCHVRIYI